MRQTCSHSVCILHFSKAWAEGMENCGSPLAGIVVGTCLSLTRASYALTTRTLYFIGSTLVAPTRGITDLLGDQHFSTKTRTHVYWKPPYLFFPHPVWHLVARPQVIIVGDRTVKAGRKKIGKICLDCSPSPGAAFFLFVYTFRNTLNSRTPSRPLCTPFGHSANLPCRLVFNTG